MEQNSEILHKVANKGSF